MYEDVQSVPTLIDWTEIGAVTSVKAQFKCSYIFNEEEVGVDECANYSGDNCGGSTPDRASLCRGSPVFQIIPRGRTNLNHGGVLDLEKILKDSNSIIQDEKRFREGVIGWCRSAPPSIRQKNYTVWTWQGEVFDIPPETTEQAYGQRTSRDVDDQIKDEDKLEDMIRDVGQESFQEAHVHDILKTDSEKALFPGCKNLTRLSETLTLVNIKARNDWSDKSFTELLEQLKMMFPEDNTLPRWHYEAKKI
ncbi:LOB domain-containing protein 21 [Phtheirospermum japonicum]|uniref:LOB domain-containing protein 21 n=1 Tax=Phtheirospermum japonicum TaxID=374723 RepID=A0A830CCM0_9LAMI|nr:LOB domain-containing protein 21 [Phtheirospermum japonicum]